MCFWLYGAVGTLEKKTDIYIFFFRQITNILTNPDRRIHKPSTSVSYGSRLAKKLGLNFPLLLQFLLSFFFLPQPNIVLSFEAKNM